MLLTKIHIPSAGKNIVHRSALHDKLNEGLHRKLTLISAPAGYGKTTLVCDWIEQNKIPAAWFSLDSRDNDPVDFLNYIISGIQVFHQAFGQSAANLLHAANKPSNESIASLLINEILQINQNFLLVLDDFHLIESSDIIDILSYLLEHIPGNIHLVVLTRSDPPFSISRLRSQHQLVELRASDLSFSANDISLLFNRNLKLGLSADDVRTLEAKTEGWIAGLQLTVLSMQGRSDISEIIQDIKGNNRYIMDYLMDEVLKNQTESIKEFLFQTSVLIQFSSGLCDAVLNRSDSQVILETLEKQNMFVIPLDSERKWYRYHPLFSDLLKQRLLTEHGASFEMLHNKTCAWFEQHNMVELALEHALIIHNHEKSAQILGEIIEDLWEKGLHTSVLKYGDLIPAERIKSSPILSLYYSWILITTGQLQKAESFLASAEKLTADIIGDHDASESAIESNKRLLGKISVALAYMNTITLFPDKVLEYARTAMQYLSKEDALWLGWIWYTAGIAKISKGDVNEGKLALQHALENSKKSNNLYLISTVAASIANLEHRLGHYRASYSHCSDILQFMKLNGLAHIVKAEWAYSGLFSMMSVIQCVWADYDGALESVKTAYDLCRNQKNIHQKIMALLAYSYVLYAREERPEALNKVTELEEVLKQNRISVFTLTIYIGWKLRILIDSNQLHEADRFAKEVGLGPDQEINYKNEHAYVFYVRLLLAQHQFREAESLLSEAYLQANAGKRFETMIYLKIQYALLYKMTGDPEKAVGNLIEAMTFAAEENIVNFFLFDLPLFEGLFSEVFKLHAIGKTNIPKRYIDNFKLALEKRNNFKNNRYKAIISSRELDTLKLIEQGFSNQEIADRLFISLNTVKTHVKTLYSKLEVDSRAKAISKARELGIA